jgi:hypothetical protein
MRGISPVVGEVRLLSAHEPIEIVLHDRGVSSRRHHIARHPSRNDSHDGQQNGSHQSTPPAAPEPVSGRDARGVFQEKLAVYPRTTRPIHVAPFAFLVTWITGNGPAEPQNDPLRTLLVVSVSAITAYKCKKCQQR